MKIYTRTGDAGDTGLFGGPRVSKAEPRVEAYGTIDELNAVLGQARATDPGGPLDRVLEVMQHQLFSVGAELATPDPEKCSVRVIDVSHIERLEQWIDHYDQTLEPLRQFILPAGSTLSAALHVARAICRRAERRVVTLGQQPGVDLSRELLVYLNRLGDLLFVLAREANRIQGVAEQPWVKPESSRA